MSSVTLKMILPGASVAIRDAPSLTARSIGCIATGDEITIEAGDVNTDDRNAPIWLRVLIPVKGFCIANHPLAATLCAGGMMFVPGTKRDVGVPGDGRKNPTDSSDIGTPITKVLKMGVPGIRINIRATPSMNARVLGGLEVGNVIVVDRFIHGANGTDWYRLFEPHRGGFCIADHPAVRTMNASELFTPCDDATDESNRLLPSSRSTNMFPPFPSEADMNSVSTPMVMFVPDVSIRIRSQPSFASTVLGDVTTNQAVLVTAQRTICIGGTDVEWLQLARPVQGYVMARHKVAFERGFSDDRLFCDSRGPMPIPITSMITGVVFQESAGGVVDGVQGGVVSPPESSTTHTSSQQPPALPPFAQPSASYQS